MARLTGYLGEKFFLPHTYHGAMRAKYAYNSYGMSVTDMVIDVAERFIRRYRGRMGKKFHLKSDIGITAGGLHEVVAIIVAGRLEKKGFWIHDNTYRAIERRKNCLRVMGVRGLLKHGIKPKVETNLKYAVFFDNSVSIISDSETFMAINRLSERIRSIEYYQKESNKLRSKNE